MDYTARKQANDRLRRHQLLPDTVKKRIPPHAPDCDSLDALTAQVKFFTPDSSWYWYVVEYSFPDTLRGLVFGSEVEYGDFSLMELETLRGPWGLPVERDLYFKPTTLGAIKREHQQREGKNARIY